MQQEDGHKQTNMVKAEEIMFYWLSQSPVHYPIEKMWKEKLKQAVDTRKSTNIPVLKLYCKEERADKMLCEQLHETFS